MFRTLFHHLQSRLSVHRLFLKIFLWFLATTWGLLTAMFLSGRMSGIQVVDPPNFDVATARVLATEIARIYEDGGPTAFSSFLRTNVDKNEQEVYLVDGSFRDVLQRNIGYGGLLIAHAAKEGRVVVLRGRFAAYKYTSPSGGHYVLLVFTKNGVGTLQEVLVGTGTRIFAGVLLLIPLLCLWLAYHIASPIRAIQVAARRVTSGDLSARAPSDVLKRHDELAALGADFNSMVERIEILLGSHKSLLASVSHELRSPLTRLSVSTALLRNGDERDRSELLDRQDRDVDLIDGLIEQLMTLSRFEMGNTSGTRETVDLARLLEQVVADGDFEAAAQDKRVIFSASDFAVIDAADDFALRSGCENVIRNAIRFTPAGETVEVQLSVDRAPALPQAIITISDRGPGVPEHLLSTIFTPFFRILSTTQREAHNGLGLAIVAGAVHMHRGQVDASNRKGGGLRVVLRLPLRTTAVTR
jgi:two-component system, OmpR family, sensor histidine kinase CpxA